MKKVFVLIMVMIMILTLAACGHSHEFGEWTTVAEANCTTDGSKERTCECGEKETDVIASAGHDYSAAEEIVAVTCTEDGESKKVCSVCGDEVVETVAATGHKFKAATAFAPKTCEACGETEGEALAKVITVGDVVESENHAFTVEKCEFAASLSEKRGNITYKHDSDFALAIKLQFTNKATSAFERWNSDRVTEVSMEYAGKYEYAGEYWVPNDDIVPLASETMYVVYEVPKTMSEDASSAILATFTIDGETYAMIVQEGDGSEEKEESAPAQDVSGAIIVGDTRTNDSTFSFEFADMYYTAKASYKEGNVTYSFNTDGSYYLVCKLDFTNLDSVAMDGWNSERITDMSMSYADKYNYEGECWIPGREIVPLDNGYVFILFAIPQEVETSTDPLSLSFAVDGNEFTVNVR